MTSTTAPNNDQAEYWNEQGGRNWVHYIERLEAMLTNLSARLLGAVDAQSGEHLLDIGCGGGTTSAAYASAVGDQGRVMGVDISAVILEVARERFATRANLHFETADAGTHLFSAASFDAITSRFGVMFFPDPVSAFTNIRKSAKPHARLRFLCWRGINENPWMGATAAAAFTVIAPPEKPAPGAPGPFSFADPDHVQNILTSAGFDSVEFIPIDETLTLGNIDDTLEWSTNMGAAAAPLAEASPADREAARAAMRNVLEAHDAAGGVTMPSAAWLVSAATE